MPRRSGANLGLMTMSKVHESAPERNNYPDAERDLRAELTAAQKRDLIAKLLKAAPAPPTSFCTSGESAVVDPRLCGRANKKSRTQVLAESLLRDRAARAIPTWRRDGADWVLFSGRRRFGRVVADSKYPEMWRSTLSGGRLSDMANLAWAKNAVLAAAERELGWEARQRAAIAPPKSPEKRGVFEGSAPPIAPDERGVL